MVGSACCRSVLAAIGVPRCSCASRAQLRATVPSSSSISGSVRFATSIEALSITSCEVAPQCTQRAASSGSSAVSAFTSGTTGEFVSRASRASASGSKRSASHAAAIASAASLGTIPASASAPASAASTSSIAWIQARSDTCSATWSGTKSPWKTPPPLTRSPKKAV